MTTVLETLYVTIRKIVNVQYPISAQIVDVSFFFKFDFCWIINFNVLYNRSLR